MSAKLGAPRLEPRPFGFAQGDMLALRVTVGFTRHPLRRRYVKEGETILGASTGSPSPNGSYSGYRRSTVESGRSRGFFVGRSTRRECGPPGIRSGQHRRASRRRGPGVAVAGRAGGIGGRGRGEAGTEIIGAQLLSAGRIYCPSLCGQSSGVAARATAEPCRCRDSDCKRCCDERPLRGQDAHRHPNAIPVVESGGHGNPVLRHSGPDHPGRPGVQRFAFLVVG